MPVANLEIMVEEPSMEAALEILLPKITPIPFHIRTHRCKQDLLAKLSSRLQGYSKWMEKDRRIIVLVDRDAEDCHALKSELQAIAKKYFPRAAANPVINRIVIEELESWYFGDWPAVRSAYPRAPDNIPLKQEYRRPDEIKGGTWESFLRILQRAGYFKNGFRKIEAARAITPFMTPEKNQSQSFQVFRETVLKMQR